jgi:hypothetical protein
MAAVPALNDEAPKVALQGILADEVRLFRRSDCCGKWAKELGGISFPLLSDPDRTACRAYGILNAAENRSFRATFIVGPDGRIL